MIIKSVELEIVCGPTSALPQTSLPQVAFAGRSNVGKSSLINSLINRKSLARTSGQPGKTRTINFYNVNKELYFVDLPGYGYAKISGETRERWGKMIEKYLNTSEQLKAIFILADIRHEAKASDRQMYEWAVATGNLPIIIATKSDKLGKNALRKHVKTLREGLGLERDTIMIPFSSVTGEGRDEVWSTITSILGKED
ncbi:MAG: ribosome biogenesis GTP-binding protein YihA/YsxC [Lachnospiraceae bacterium]|jgi:GTP-binding protein